MTTPRDPDAILAAWLEEGPNRLPDATRRAIAVSTRTTHQARLPTWLPWRVRRMNGMTRLALAAVAVVAVVVGGLFVLRPGTDPSGSGPGSVRGVPAVDAPDRQPSPSRSPPALIGVDAGIHVATVRLLDPVPRPAGHVTPTTGEGPTGWRRRRLRRRGRGLVSPRLVGRRSGRSRWSTTGSVRRSSSLTFQGACLRRDTLETSHRRRPRRQDPGLLWCPTGAPDRGDRRRRRARLSLHLVRCPVTHQPRRRLGRCSIEFTDDDHVRSRRARQDPPKPSPDP